MKFTKLDSYNKDIKNFIEAIDTIQNPVLKKQKQVKLNRLQLLAKQLDELHQPDNGGRINLKSAKEVIQEMAELRLEFNNFIKKLD